MVRGGVVREQSNGAWRCSGHVGQHLEWVDDCQRHVHEVTWARAFGACSTHQDCLHASRYLLGLPVLCVCLCLCVYVFHALFVCMCVCIYVCMDVRFHMMFTCVYIHVFYALVCVRICQYQTVCA